MFVATCDYIVYPKKNVYSIDDYIIGKFKTSSENVPVGFRQGKRTITFTAKGKGIPTDKKFDVLLSGKWSFSEKYGLELSVEKADISIPSDEAGIKTYLSTFLKGCGPRTAQKIYDKFGQATLMILSTEPEKLLEVKGIRKKQLQRMLSSYKETQKYQELATLLTPFGVSKKQIEKISDILGENAKEQIKENPFILDSKLRGFSFDTLEAMSHRFGCNACEPLRCKAGIKYCLKQAMSGSKIFSEERLQSGGNLFVNQYVLRTAAMNVLNSRTDSCVSSSYITNIFCEMHDKNELLGVKGNVYLPNNFSNEQLTAKYVSEILYESKVKRFSDNKIQKVLNASENALNIKLSKNQQEAVYMVHKNPISIITGGAGTGKTTVLKVILECFKRLGTDMNRVCLAAPTGKAAILMKEKTGYPAYTLHRTLGIIEDEDYYKSEEEIEELDADFIICDEFSMVDMFLAHRLFAAAKRKSTRILLIGDPGQLPSVGAGKVLYDLVQSNCVPVTALNVIFRQAQDSNIVKNSHNINEGVPYIDFSKDFLLFEDNDTDAILQKTVDKYLEEVKKYGLDETVVLSPIKNKGSLCTSKINAVIQERINPLKPDMVEKKLHGTLFREHDRIIQLKNRVVIDEKGKSFDICNGDTGYILSISKGFENSYTFKIKFDDERVITFEEEDMKNVTLAYALTVHKSQGSEYSSVIFPLHSYMPINMITRNFLYTAVTRAKKQLIVVGEKKIIYKAINNNTAYNRNTALSEKVRQYCSYYNEETEEQNV